VIRRILTVSCVLVVSVFALSFSASAQLLPISACVTQTQYCPLCGDPGIGFFNCVVEITILDICNVMLPTCWSPAPSEPCPTCANGGPAVASNPVNLATGNTYIEQSDIRVPGLGGGLSLVRTWNSRWPATQSALQVGLFGPNWRSTFEERVFVGSDHYMKYSRADGSFWSFGYSGPTWILAGPASLGAGMGLPILRTATIAAPYLTITFQNGEQRRFDGTSGALTSITDRNGNTTTLTYDGVNRLATVTDPASRTLTFTYQSPSSHLVTGVSSSVGISLTYAYDGQNRLSQVTNPDLTTLTFWYDSQSRITSVTDSNGKVLESHTYDSSSRGLTSSRALGVEAVTLSYPNP